MHHFYSLFKDTVVQFRRHNISSMAASLAYFGLFATAPIILITITILNIFLSDQQIRYSLVNEVGNAAGPQVADTVELILLNSQKNTPRNIVFQIITVITLILTATTLFIQLRQTLNTLWDIKPRKNDTIQRLIKTRVFSLFAIIAAGIALYIFFVVSIAINLLGTYFEVISGYNAWYLQNVNFIVSFFFIIGILTCIFKYIPEARISWMDALLGGTFTASLFTIGRYILTLYFSWNVIGSIYGTAGSLLVFLVWIYFSALIFMFGAKFTHVYAEKIGNGIAQK